jgi:acyl carrier protein
MTDTGSDMSKRTDTIAEAVKDALTKVSSEEGSPEATHDSEQMLQGLDSLGLMLAMADIQATLQLEFEPEQLVQLFQCRTIEALTVLISRICADANRDGQLGRPYV